MNSLLQRDTNHRHTWRLLGAIFGIALSEYLIDFNLAIHNTLEKLRLPDAIWDWLDILIGKDWGMLDVFWLGVMVLLWVFGFVRLLQFGVVWYVLGSVITIIASVVVLVITAAFRNEDVWGLLWDATLVWTGNIVVFASWYWLIDAEHAQVHPENASSRQMEFLFPQRAGELMNWRNWQPQFFDYLFLAFTTSTTFGPAETAPLSKRAKALMMLQAIISLIVVAVLVARAIGILKPPI